MSVKIEEFVAHLGWEVDATQLKDFNAQVKDTISFFAKAAAAIIGATTALTAFTVATTKQTSIQTRLAEAYGMSAEAVENWGFLLGGVGLEAENVLRLAKDLNVRLGQAFAGIGDANTIKDAVAALGIEFELLRKKKPEEQFRTILQAAKDLDDEQAALAASQQLLGRQGAIVTGFLRDQEGSVEDLLREQAKYNLLTEENREQAKAFVALVDNTGAVLDSAKASFAAFLGEALSPLLKEFLEWVKANRELIKTRIAEWAERVGRFIEITFRVLKWGFFALKKVVDAFGGLENVLAGLAGIIAGIGISKLIKLFTLLGPLIVKGTKAIKAFGAAGAIAGGKWMLLGGLLLIAGLAINSLIRWFQGRDSLVGDLGEKTGEQIQKGIHALAEWMGISGEILDRAIVITIDKIEDMFASIWRGISGFFKEMWNLDWPGLFEAWGAVWSMAVNSLRRLWDDFLHWFTITMPQKILIALAKLVPRAIQILRQIPLVGEAVAGALKNIQIGLSGPAARQQTSPGVTQTINQTKAMQSAVTNISRQGGDIYVTAPMSITQQPGESGEALARRIQQGFREEMSLAIRDNDTGIEY